MADSETFISYTAKAGDYQNAAFTIHAATLAEFQDIVMQLGSGREADAQAFLGRVIDVLFKSPNYDLIAKDSGTPGEQKSGSWGGGGNRSGGGAKQYPPDPGRPDGPAPRCEHGEKEWKNPSKKPWKGWFCPAKGREGDCATEWIND